MKLRCGVTGMIRSRAHSLISSSLLVLPLVASLGCDELTVRSFAGATMQFTISVPGATPVGTHLEVWARDSNNSILRIEPFYDQNAYKTAPGLIVRQAISATSPCMTDANGNLLTDAAAYPGPVKFGNITQSPEQQAQQVQQRIAQLNPSGGRPLMAILPWDPLCDADGSNCHSQAEVVVPDGSSPADRKAICDGFRGSPLFYVPNPLQITAPLHGAVYGFADFTTLQPPTNYNGFRLDTPVSLKGLQEIFLTVEGDNVDPNKRGPLYLASTRVQGGVGVLQFTLINPADQNGASGAVAVYTDLDEDPVQF
jgi:hypothetical protein